MDCDFIERFQNLWDTGKTFSEPENISKVEQEIASLNTTNNMGNEIDLHAVCSRGYRRRTVHPFYSVPTSAALSFAVLQIRCSPLTSRNRSLETNNPQYVEVQKICTEDIETFLWF